MRLTKLQNLNIANSPILTDDIATKWEDENSEYAKQYADEDLSWSNLKDLTDLELYNCPKMRGFRTLSMNCPSTVSEPCLQQRH